MSEKGGPIRFLLNGKPQETHAAPGSPVLDLIRSQGLLATREGCREGDCGACMVLLGECDTQNRVRYRPLVSCLLPLADIAGGHLVTAEGLSGHDLTPVQQALIDEGAVQCGFCTPGLVIALTGFLLNSPVLDEVSARGALDGNLCRCTGYVSIVRAAGRLIDRFAEQLPDDPGERIAPLILSGVLPPFFNQAETLLAGIAPPPQPPVEARVIGGATDLLVQRPKSLIEAPFALIRHRPKARGIHEEGDEIVIGAATTFAELQDSPLLNRVLPDLPEMMGKVASTPIRNRATLGGNIVNASPIGDLTILMLAMGARLRIDGSGGERELALEALYLGYKTLALAPGEWLVQVVLPAIPPETRIHFEKVSKRSRLDIASVNSALSILVDGTLIQEARLSAGGIAPVPKLLKRTSAFLAGRAISLETVCGAVREAAGEIAPIDDIRGSATYKRLLLERLVRAHFLTLFPHYLASGDPG